MAPERITETELILPALYLMVLNTGLITTTELSQKLRLIMKPTGEDLAILAGRNDDKFSQKVRNLRAHNTFERTGYAAYDKGARGYVRITEAGKEHLAQNQEILRYLLVNDFPYDVLTDALQTVEASTAPLEDFDENIIIQEGLKKITEVERYERSSHLRDYALTFFAERGGLMCHCCRFDFSAFYGKEIGGGFIEIHHIKPIFQQKGENLIQTIKVAVQNLMPVCSNCHRMIHRNWSKPREVQYLIEGIRANGVFPGTLGHA